MKKYTYTFAIILVCCSLSQAQWDGNSDFCDDTNITTDPQSPIDLRGQPYINQIQGTLDPKFDWMNDIFHWFQPAPGGGATFCMVDNPFNAFNNTENIHHFIDNDGTAPDLRDNKVADGWELISFEFGTLYNGNVATNLDHPKFILYNKHSGVLRVFYYLREANFNLDYDIVTLKLQFFDDPSSDFEPAILNHIEEVAKPLDSYRKNLIEESSNQLNNGQSTTNPCSGMWIYADFTMAYDPCVCHYRYKRLKITVRVVDEGTIELVGDLATKPINKTLGNSGSADVLSNYKTAYKTVSEVAKTAKTQYKSTAEYTNDVASKYGKKLPAKKEAELLSNLGTLGQAVPYLGAAIGVVNYFLAKERESDKPASAPITFNASVHIKGSITQWGEAENKLLGVPGSIHTNMPIQDIPLYNEPVGVLSLLETPQIEFTEHRAGVRNSNNLIVPYIYHQGMPIVTRYKVKENIKLALNPSSELELEDVKVSLVMEYTHTGYAARKDFHNTINSTTIPTFFNYPYIPGGTALFNKPLGPGAVGGSSPFKSDQWAKIENSPMNLELFQVDSLYKTSIGQTSIGCFNGTTLTLISSRNADPGNQPKIVLRINAILIHPTTNIRYKMIQSYELDPSTFNEAETNSELTLYEITPFDENEQSVQYQLGSYLSWGNLSSTIFNNYKHIPDFLIFENESIGPGTLEAWNGIIIRDNVTIASGTDLLAGKYIKLRNENNVSPEVSMKIGVNNHIQACISIDPMNYIVSDYGTFCNNNSTGSYKAHASKRSFYPIVNSDNTQRFNIYPNPTDNLVHIEVDLIEGATYDIQVLDLSGRAVYYRSVSSSEFNNSTMSINTSSFESGIYFVNVIEGTNRLTKRLVIAR